MVEKEKERKEGEKRKQDTNGRSSGDENMTPSGSFAQVSRASTPPRLELNGGDEERAAERTHGAAASGSYRRSAQTEKGPTPTLPIPPAWPFWAEKNAVYDARAT